MTLFFAESRLQIARHVNEAVRTRSQTFGDA